MNWVSIEKRKPEKSGYYYWKGKHNYGGLAYYNTEIIQTDLPYGFEFDEEIPLNKIDEGDFYWLDEEKNI